MSSHQSGSIRVRKNGDHQTQDLVRTIATFLRAFTKVLEVRVKDCPPRPEMTLAGTLVWPTFLDWRVIILRGWDWLTVRAKVVLAADPVNNRTFAYVGCAEVGIVEPHHGLLGMFFAVVPPPRSVGLVPVFQFITQLTHPFSRL